MTLHFVGGTGHFLMSKQYQHDKETKTNKSTKENGGSEMSNQANKGVSSSRLYFFLEDVTIASQVPLGTTTHTPPSTFTRSHPRNPR